MDMGAPNGPQTPIRSERRGKAAPFLYHAVCSSGSPPCPEETRP